MDKMQKDLRWLAENVDKWGGTYIRPLIFFNSERNCVDYCASAYRHIDRVNAYTHDQWQAARQQLEDERMDRIGQNGNDGAHYDVIMTEEEEAMEVDERVEWDGDGLPPVGALCRCSYVKQGTSYNGKCEILGYNDGKVWFNPTFADHQVMPVSSAVFRPIRTKAERDREDLESTLLRWKDSTVEVIAGILIDNGWKKGDRND